MYFTTFITNKLLTRLFENHIFWAIVCKAGLNATQALFDAQLKFRLKIIIIAETIKLVRYVDKLWK